MKNTQKICYCFNYTDADIKKDVHENSGRSLILERIEEEKKAGNCHCALNHPEGR